MHLSICILPLLLRTLVFADGVEYDKNGYVIYCPCMGRFGNQVDHFLGSLSFARKLNRTLVVPPWITHKYGRYDGDSFPPYNHWFNVDTLKSYHRIIEMEDFMKNLAPSIWPPNKRKIYCHEIAFSRSDDKKSCPAKSGNPFGAFWDNFKVEFIASEGFPGNLNYHSPKTSWDHAYPSETHLVLAFMGAPAAYPVKAGDRSLQKYVEWKDEVKNAANEVIKNKLQRPYVGIHLRNGMDWKRACEHVKDGIDYPFMSSPQCTGYKGRFTYEMCFPSDNTVKTHVLHVAKAIGANSLFIATDAKSFEEEFKSWFKEAGLNIDIIKLQKDELNIDLAVLIESDTFIGSCGSSVSAFVSRKRKVLERPNEFFGNLGNLSTPDHTEL